MTWGRADCADDWLPARVRPVRGESFDSLCRRLAAVNGTRPAQLLRACMSRQPDAHEPMAAVARCIGLEHAELESLTMTRVRRGWGRRLATTEWLCRRCSSEGIEDALRSLYVQFLCLRCGSFLSRCDDRDSDLIVASDADRAFQDELLDACVFHPNSDFVSLAVGLATGIGNSVAWGAPELMRDAKLAALVRAYVKHRRSAVGDLGVPEDPRLVSGILRLACDIAASEQVHHLAMCALGYRYPRPEKEPQYFRGVSTSMLCSYMPTGSAPLIEVVTGGVRIRDLVQNHGLQSAHVPWDVRFAGDQLIIDTTRDRWRQYVCLQLRHWLRCLEVTARSDHTSREYADTAYTTFTRPDPLVQRSVYHIEPEDAAIFLSQMLCLAQDLAARPLALPTVSVPQISLSTLYQLAPAAAAAVPASRGVRVARYWMWWDDARGRDAYSYLPSCSPSELAAFDQSLGDDDRDALREYRARHSQDGAEFP
jgi:hypothetical protein